jgi:hypothetical protein
MSLVPPSAIVMSKLRFLLEKRLNDLPNKEEVLKLAGPYPEFRLVASVRPLDGSSADDMTYPDEAIQDLTEQPANKFVCSDTALNMMTRLKHKIKNSIKNPCVLKLSLQSREEASENAWSDVYLDEFHLNINYVELP